MVHFTTGVGVDVNQGYDTFAPLINSGIYACQPGQCYLRHEKSTTRKLVI